MVNTVYGADPGTPAEKAVTWTRPGWGHQSNTAIIYAHGSGDVALSMLAKPELDLIGRLIAQRSRIVIAGDNAGQAWCNGADWTRINAQIDWAVSQGAAEQVVLVGVSMGGGSVLGFANAYPERVKAVAALIPLVDIQSLYDLPSSIPARQAGINAAYPPAYNDATHGPDHSPIHFAGDLPEDLPIKIWWSSNDPMILPDRVAAFIADRPQTEQLDIGAAGHGFTTPASHDVGDWVATHI